MKRVRRKYIYIEKSSILIIIHAAFAVLCHHPFIFITWTFLSLSLPLTLVSTISINFHSNTNQKYIIHERIELSKKESEWVSERENLIIFCDYCDDDDDDGNGEEQFISFMWRTPHIQFICTWIELGVDVLCLKPSIFISAFSSCIHLIRNDDVTIEMTIHKTLCDMKLNNHHGGTLYFCLKINKKNMKFLLKWTQNSLLKKLLIKFEYLSFVLPLLRIYSYLFSTFASILISHPCIVDREWKEREKFILLRKNMYDNRHHGCRRCRHHLGEWGRELCIRYYWSWLLLLLYCYRYHIDAAILFYYWRIMHIILYYIEST